MFANLPTKQLPFTARLIGSIENNTLAPFLLEIVLGSGKQLIIGATGEFTAVDSGIDTVSSVGCQVQARQAPSGQYQNYNTHTPTSSQMPQPDELLPVAIIPKKTSSRFLSDMLNILAFQYISVPVENIFLPAPGIFAAVWGSTAGSLAVKRPIFPRTYAR